MRKKRWTLLELRRAEDRDGESYIRELEMDVEGIVHHPLQVLQFWKDVELYGVDEAILLVKNNGKDVSQITAAWRHMLPRVIGLCTVDGIMMALDTLEPEERKKVVEAMKRDYESRV